MTTDIYGSKKQNSSSSLRYIHIDANHVVGILNRITSLMRRKRYNIEEVSVSFDDKKSAKILLAIDGELFDIEQIIHQINKLNDVIDVYDATHLKESLYDVVYVKTTIDFSLFPIKPDKIIKYENDFKGVFLIPVNKTAQFIQFLHENNYSYVRRILSLI